MACFNLLLATCLIIIGLSSVNSLQCASCSYSESSWSSSGGQSSCLTDPASETTVSCDTMCYTWGYNVESIFDSMNLNVERGCASTLENSTWELNGCGEYTVDYSYTAYVCTCDEDGCNADDSGFTQCYDCESSIWDDYNCMNDLEANYEPIPCLTGGTRCAVRTIDYDSWLSSDSFERYCTDEEANGTSGDCSTDANNDETCYYYCEGDGCNTRGGALSVASAALLISSMAMVSLVQVVSW
ncbi:uncharacterized protein LOC100377290 [Saccoglossus kowalevskii]|uniref:Uncharacterized protein LOC100377290 n=1 Tax=Saccoglossus kowalevskii TaxID=10224 RepID=A0ABM0GYB0_SACKO|nr:PREDICTED: uncharacterized protein LOC100377290 [Saccoglossus kowalevskii]